MSAYGLTSTGFTPATVEELLKEVEDDQHSLIDADLDVAPDQPIGQLNGIIVSKLAEAWEALDTAFASFDDTKAEDTQLDALCALTGTIRPGDKKGTVSVNCTLTAGTVLPTTARVADIDDASNTWALKTEYTATATGVVALIFECTRVGAVEAPAGKLTVIVTPVAGWSTATNPLDAKVGRLKAQDPELRTLRRAELSDLGNSSVPSLQAALLKVTGVISAKVLENATGLTDSRGLPPHSVEAVVWDGIVPGATDASIRDCVFANTAAGIQSYGDTIGTVTDEYGNPHTVSFKRCKQILVSFYMTLVQDPSLPAISEPDVKAAVVAYGSLSKPGQDTILEKLKAIVTQIPGVYDIAVAYISTPEFGILVGNLPVEDTEIATFDTSRVHIGY